MALHSGTLKEQPIDWTSYDYLIRQGIFEPNNTIEFISTYLENGQDKIIQKSYGHILYFNNGIRFINKLTTMEKVSL